MQKYTDTMVTIQTTRYISDITLLSTWRVRGYIIRIAITVTYARS